MSRSPKSIRVKGRSAFNGLYTTYGMKRHPETTFYDGSAIVEAFRRAEVELGEKGYLDEASAESAKRTAENLANPIPTEFDLEFGGNPPKGWVIVRHEGGRSHKLELTLEDLSDKGLSRLFRSLDSTMAQMVGDGAGPAMV